MNRILIAEDEQRIATFLEHGLRSHGYQTTTVSDGPSAYDYASSGSFDLMLLDIGLPLMDGFAVLRRLREANHAIPVIILTARASLADTVSGFDSGADDYLAKPFRFDELLARIRARLRTTRGLESTALSHGNLTLDLLTRRALVGDTAIDLSAREFNVMEEFMRHPGAVLSREQLLSRVWGFDFAPGSNIVDVYVGNLRRKIGADRITTVRGMGYRLEEKP